MNVKPTAPQAKLDEPLQKSAKPKDVRKLSYKEERELERLPEQIEKLEEEHSSLYALLADISFYQKDPKEVAKAQARVEAIGEELLRAYERWEYLESCKKLNV